MPICHDLGLMYPSSTETSAHFKIMVKINAHIVEDREQGTNVTKHVGKGVLQNAYFPYDIQSDPLAYISVHTDASSGRKHTSDLYVRPI